MAPKHWWPQNNFFFGARGVILVNITVVNRDVSLHGHKFAYTQNQRIIPPSWKQEFFFSTRGGQLCSGFGGKHFFLFLIFVFILWEIQHVHSDNAYVCVHASAQNPVEVEKKWLVFQKETGGYTKCGNQWVSLPDIPYFRVKRQYIFFLLFFCKKKAFFW